MVGRDVTEGHRAASPLELFFDLTFVVAVAQVASALHHGVVEGDVGAVVSFLLTFFAIWWAWMNFTWFASAYDTDDVLYRAMVFVQMTGVLVLAAGVPRAFDNDDFKVVTVGYVIMRLAMVAQWLRAAASHPEGRASAVRYAMGISLVQIGWILRLGLSDRDGFVAFGVLVVLELSVPVWAEAAGRTNWHPGHMAERYGLFTIIVLGESILAATIGVQEALDRESVFGDLATVVVGGLLIVFLMWWIYFDLPREAATDQLRTEFDDNRLSPFIWGYGHYFVFAAIAATGAGLAVAVDQATNHSEIADITAAAALTIPVAVFLLVVWMIHRPVKKSDSAAALVLVAALTIFAGTFTPEPVLLTGVVLLTLTVADVLVDRGARSPA